ncbi:MAG: hypothetical protein NVS3B20_06470 [Polyangiales bacterium]
MIALLLSVLMSTPVRGSLSVSDRSEVRVRQTDPVEGRVLDVETAPRADLHLDTRLTEFTLAYSPRFTVRHVNLEQRPEVLQTAFVRETFRERHAQFSVYEDATFGNQNFGYLLQPGATTTFAPQPGQATPGVETLPASTTILYESLRTGFSARVTPARRWVYLSLFEYVVSGGADEASRKTLPLQYGPRGEQSIEYAASRRDQLISTWSASRVIVSSGPEITLIETSESVRHHFSLHTQSVFLAGFARVALHSSSQAPLSYVNFPVGEVSVLHALAEDHLDLRFAVRVAPMIDRLNGQVDERVQATLASVFSPSRRFSLRAQAGALQSVPSDARNALSLAIGEASVAYQAGRHFTVEGGARFAVQKQIDAPVGPLQSIFFLAATAATQPLLF